MATHDYNIANSSGINVRSDLNAVLAAILSQNSSATEPTTTAGGMFWYDTATGIFKQRNSTNTGWVDKWDTSKGMLATLNSPTFVGPVNLPTTTYVGGNGVATTQAPIFSGNSVFETLTAWSSVSLPASTTIGGVSATELSYLDGLTSAIQSQLNAKQPTLVSGTNIKTVGGVSILGGGDVPTGSLSSIFANSQEFTASGTFTVPAGITKVYVELIGGGGGGGSATRIGGGIHTVSASAGGGCGSIMTSGVISVSPLESCSVIVGNGGVSDGDGGNSSFKGTITSYGGYAGDSVISDSNISNGSSVGNGGEASYPYSPIVFGESGSTALNGTGGNGGSSIFNNLLNGGSGQTANGNGASATNLGSGGGGANIEKSGNSALSYSGGSGGAGKVIVYW